MRGARVIYDVKKVINIIESSKIYIGCFIISLQSRKTQYVDKIINNILRISYNSNINYIIIPINSNNDIDIMRELGLMFNPVLALYKNGFIKRQFDIFADQYIIENYINTYI